MHVDGPEEHYIVATGPKILLQVQVSKYKYDSEGLGICYR